MDMASLSSTSGAKNMATFLETISQQSPHTVYRHFPVLLPLLDSPVHQIRSAMVSSMGNLVGYTHKCIKEGDGKEESTTEEGFTPPHLLSSSLFPTLLQ
jgi:hypothetical protein